MLIICSFSQGQLCSSIVICTLKLLQQLAGPVLLMSINPYLLVKSGLTNPNAPSQSLHCVLCFTVLSQPGATAQWYLLDCVIVLLRLGLCLLSLYMPLGAMWEFTRLLGVVCCTPVLIYVTIALSVNYIKNLLFNTIYALTKTYGQNMSAMTFKKIWNSTLLWCATFFYFWNDILASISIAFFLLSAMKGIFAQTKKLSSKGITVMISTYSSSDGETLSLSLPVTFQCRRRLHFFQ